MVLTNGYITSGLIAVMGRLITSAVHLIVDAHNRCSSCTHPGITNRRGYHSPL